MSPRGTSVVARKVRRPARGPIGFAVRDLAGRGCAFEIDEASAEALVFGSSSALRISAPGVLPAHFVVLPHDGKLVAASASKQSPAVLNGAPLPTSWTVLEVPSRVRLGAAAVDFFYVRDRVSGTMLVDLDIETTVADPGSDDATRVDASGPHRRFYAPQPLRPLRPAPLGPIARPPVTTRNVLVAALVYVRQAWSRASMSTCVLLGIVALLLAFLIAR